MHFILRCLPKPQSQYHHQWIHRRTIVDARIKCIRDRGLDHAVEKEKNLKPMLNMKNLIKSEPSKSVPISLLSEKRESLEIPIRPIDFIRKYPSIFEEYCPGGIGIHPHIRLTPQVLNLDAEVQVIYQSETYRQQVANRVLKLLMLSRTNKVPLSIIDRLKWDLGLPQDYEKTIVPEFPDYFQIVGDSGTRVLELVCWSNELATSVMERKANKKGIMPIAFPMQFSRGFEMDKKLSKWVDEWNKLPYISPYENASNLPPKSDQSDKWAVAILHELLHILVPKKTERENLLCLGEYLGLRSRFKRALLNHPGIFYLSSKIGTYTVVLKEGYKRGLLIEDHPFMTMRNQYIHLMNTVKEDSKPISLPGGRNQQKNHTTTNKIGKGEEEDDEHEGELYDSSDVEVEDKNESQRGVQENVADKRGRIARKTNSDVKGSSRKSERERADGKQSGNNKQKVPRAEMCGGHNACRNLREKSSFSKSRGKSLLDKRISTS